MNTMLVLALVVAVASAVGIAVAVGGIVSKGQRAEQANAEAEQALIDLAQAERDLAVAKGQFAKGQSYQTPDDMKSITVADPDGSIALWKAQNGY